MSCVADKQGPRQDADLCIAGHYHVDGDGHDLRILVLRGR